MELSHSLFRYIQKREDFIVKIDWNTPSINLLTITFLIVIFFVILSIVPHNHGSEASVMITKSQLNSFKGVSESYFTNTGKAPSKLEDFVRAPANNHPWKQLLEEIPKDPWENEYLYSLMGNIVTISSNCPTDNISDDIKVSFDVSRFRMINNTGWPVKIVEDDLFLKLPIK